MTDDHRKDAEVSARLDGWRRSDVAVEGVCRESSGGQL
jgi:hypothetical protein